MCLFEVSLFMGVNFVPISSIFLINYLCYLDFQIYLLRLFQINAFFRNFIFYAFQFFIGSANGLPISLS